MPRLLGSRPRRAVQAQWARSSLESVPPRLLTCDARPRREGVRESPEGFRTSAFSWPSFIPHGQLWASRRQIPHFQGPPAQDGSPSREARQGCASAARGGRFSSTPPPSLVQTCRSAEGRNEISDARFEIFMGSGKWHPRRRCWCRCVKG